MLGLAPPVLTLDAALRDLGSRDPRVRAAAVDALGDVPVADRPRAADALLAALSDPAAPVRASAALALGELGLERTVAPLARCLDDGAAMVRQTAVIALGRLGLRSSWALLRAALRDGPPDVRFQAATSLVEIDADQALAPLLEALDDDDGEVVGAAALGLATIGDASAVEPLAARLDHTRRETRFDVAYALAALGEARALEPLAGFVADPALGWDAVEALERSGQPAAVAPLAAAAREERHAREVRMRAAAGVIALAPDGPDAAAVRGVLVRGLDALRFRHRALAVTLLGQVGGAWARPPLEVFARRLGGRRLRDEIAAALARIDGAP